MKELRQLAEKASFGDSPHAAYLFQRAANPQAVLGLLDRIEALEKDLAAAHHDLHEAAHGTASELSLLKEQA